MHAQRRHAARVFEGLEAAKRWDAHLNEGVDHPIVEQEGCRHCEARRELRRAIANVDVSEEESK
jgi:hypothetical protein